MTFLGHAGMYVETEGGTRPVRPVVQPGVLRVLVPVPPQRLARPGARSRARTTSTSRTCTTTTSTRRGSPSTSTSRPRCCCPAFELDHLEQALRDARLHRVRAHRAREAGPARRARGRDPRDDRTGRRSRRATRRWSSRDSTARILEPERRPAPGPRTSSRRSARSTRTSPSSRARSGTRWSTTSRPTRSARSASASAPTRWSGRCTTCATSHAPHIFPIAGPPCFLDDDLFAFNDLDDDPTNIFPDQTVFLARDGARGACRRASCSCPARVATLVDGDCTVEQPAGDARARRDLRRQARRRSSATATTGATGSRASSASWPTRPASTSWPRCAEWWEPLLDLAPLTRAGVGAPVLLHVGDVGVLDRLPGRDGARVERRAGRLPHRHRPRARRVAASSATSRTG